MSDSLKSKTLHGIIWNAFQRFSATGIRFIFMIFMTRLLLPSDYGMIGMLMVFMDIANAFIDCGFGQALIRKQDRTARDESTVFFFNIIASSVCYLIIFAIAPLVARFYEMPELCKVLRYMALTLIISSLSSVHAIIYSIKLNFKIPSIVNVISSIVAGFIALYMAYLGWGVWALVWQMIMQASFVTIAYWVLCDWHPYIVFSSKSFKEMFAFGSKILGTTLLNRVYQNITPIFVGKAYNSSQLGLFTKAETMAGFPCGTLYSVVDSVSYPVLCQLQSDKVRLTEIYRRFIRSLSFLVCPIMAILCVLGTPLMVALFGEEWRGAGLYFSLLCYPWMLVPIQCMNLNLLKVVGRSDLFLRLEIIGKLLGVTMLFITLPISIEAMCIGTIVNVTICFFINAHYTSRFIDLTISDQLQDILKSFLASVVVAIIVYYFTLLFNNNWTKLILGGLLGTVLYVGGSLIFKARAFYNLLDLVKKQ